MTRHVGTWNHVIVTIFCIESRTHAQGRANTPLHQRGGRKRLSSSRFYSYSAVQNNLLSGCMNPALWLPLFSDNILHQNMNFRVQAITIRYSDYDSAFHHRQPPAYTTGLHYGALYRRMWRKTAMGGEASTDRARDRDQPNERPTCPQSTISSG